MAKSSSNQDVMFYSNGSRQKDLMNVSKNVAGDCSEVGDDFSEHVRSANNATFT